MLMQEKTKLALKDLLGSAAVATMLRIDKTTVLRIAERCHVGMEVAGRMLFSQDDVEVIRSNYNGGPGNPNFKKNG